MFRERSQERATQPNSRRVVGDEERLRFGENASKGRSESWEEDGYLAPMLLVDEDGAPENLSSIVAVQSHEDGLVQRPMSMHKAAVEQL